MAQSIIEITKRLRKDQQLKNYRIENKIKTGEGEKRLSRIEAINRIAKITNKYNSMEYRKRALQKELGLDYKQANEVLQAIKGRGLSRKEIQALEKRQERFKRINIFQSNRDRSADELMDRREGKNAVKSMKDDSARLMVSGMEYQAGGIHGKKVSTQDLRGERKGNVSDLADHQTSGAGFIPQSGNAAARQSEGAASVAGGFGVKKIPGGKSGNVGSGGRGAAPIGFRKAA